jgi:hypothetical protein
MSVEVWFPFAALAFAALGILWAHLSGKALDRRRNQDRRDHPAE